MKAILLFIVTIFSISQLKAQQSKGPISATNSSNEPFAGSNRSWTTVQNVVSSDDQYSDFGNLSNIADSYTDYLHVNTFLLNIPLDAIITGIEINIERSDPDKNTADYSIRLLKYDIEAGDDKSNGEPYSISDEVVTFGGAGDLWGGVWTPDMINDNGFGVAISAQRINGSPGQTSGRIDNVTITIYYDQPSTLPVTLLNFSAKKNNKSIDLTWTTEQESNLSYYELQRSANGRNFSGLHTIQSRNSTNKTVYSYTDSKPINGIAYYRLKTIEVDGSISYSKIVTVQFATGNSVTIYPTLWKKGTTLNISNPNNEKLTAYFFTATGQKVGVATTNNSAIPTTILNEQNGIIYYSIINAEGMVASKGSIVIN